MQTDRQFSCLQSFFVFNNLKLTFQTIFFLGGGGLNSKIDLVFDCCMTFRIKVVPQEFVASRVCCSHAIFFY